MEIKEIAPFTVIFHSMRTTLATIVEDAGHLPEKIAEDASKAGLQITGPNMWIYDGADGHLEKEFTLNVAYPIASAAGYAGDFACKELPTYKCLSGIHTGSFDNVAETYKEMSEEAVRQGYAPNDWSREVYLNWVGHNAPENKTEIQLGIVPVSEMQKTA